MPGYAGPRGRGLGDDPRPGSAGGFQVPRLGWAVQPAVEAGQECSGMVSVACRAVLPSPARFKVDT